jgi:hypothetical protein
MFCVEIAFVGRVVMLYQEKKIKINTIKEATRKKKMTKIKK